MAPFKKIFFRYLFIRLLVPFAVCLCGCTLIWIMADFLGNVEDFLEHKINILVILRFYGLLVPSMLVQVLPAALLFSTLWTLMSLNRRCELVAFQSGGMAPIWLFTPFFLFSLILVLLLGFDLNWPAAQAEVTRERLLEQVKGQSAKSNVFENLPYVDSVNRRTWFFQSLDINQGTARGVELLQSDAQGHDVVKYFAREGKWTGDFWRLSGVLKISFGVDGGVQDQKTYQELDLPDITTPPRQLSLIVSQPDQLTFSQLSQYIDTSTSTPEHLAGYRTEWWYRLLFPFSLIVLLLFALLQGARTDRRTAAVGVFWAIVVLIAFNMVMGVFMTAGRFNRLPPFVAAIATEVIFGAIGLHLLALSNGWWWQLLEIGKRWKAQWQELGEEPGESDEAR
jgi:lipopolysaccharide export system permease protein